MMHVHAMHTCLHVRKHMQICSPHTLYTYMCTCTCTYTHIRMYTHTHMYKHAYSLGPSPVGFSGRTHAEPGEGVGVDVVGDVVDVLVTGTPM